MDKNKQNPFEFEIEDEELQKQSELKKQAEAKKEAQRKEAEKKKNAPPPKLYYDVKVECMLPATLTYRVLAENPQQASDLIKGMNPNSVHHKLIGRKEMVLRVYDASGCVIRFMKKLVGA
jgi:hypothetical protein